MPRKPIVALDGPAGAGKSTVGKRLAVRLGVLYIDSGAMYRAVAWKGLQTGVLDDSRNDGALTPDQEAALVRLAETTRLRLEGDPFHLRVFADDVEITSAIRTPQVSRFASVVSAVAGVRTALVAQQQAMGRESGVVMDGRDIGTHVFPDADVKFYLDASLDARSRRRWEELTTGDATVAFEDVRAEVAERDLRDTTRAAAPLRVAEGAIVVDTSDLTVEQVVELMFGKVMER